MKQFALDLAFRGLRWYVSGGVFDRIAALVAALIAEDIPGADKRARVIAFTRNEYGLIWGELTNTVLDAVIAVTRIKAAQALNQH